MIELEFAPATIGWLSAAGLLWDLSGALFLARGLFAASDERLRRQAASTFGTNPAAVRGFAEQQLDTKYGVSQLAFGFALQVAASFGLRISLGLASFVAAPILLVWLHYSWNSDYYVVRKSLRIGPSPESLESIWRRNFDDVRDSTWARAKKDSGVRFAPEPTT